MIIDPIGDLLTRVRNGYMSRSESITVPYSKLKEDLSKILKKNKYVTGYEVVATDDNKKSIVIGLNDVRKTKYIPTLKRISKPGQRIYLGAKDIRKSRNGHGIYIISTPKGVITGYEARSLNVWGELLCEVY